MLRNWKTLALYSLMTTAVYVQVPSPAAAQDKEKEKNLVDSIDQLKKTIDDSFKGVRADFMALKDEVMIIQDDGLKQRLSLSAAAGKIEDIEKALDDLKIKVQSGSASKAAGIDKSSVEEIKLKLGAIEQAILKLQPATSRIAMAPPASVGRVVLLNLYPEKLLFVVNDKSYVVPANSTVSLDNLPAGTLTYELIADYWGSRGRNSSKLAANETLTLTAK